MEEQPHPHHRKKRHSLEAEADFLRQQFAQHTLPTGPTAESYRIVGYQDGLIGAARPECDLLLPHYDSGLTWPDENNPQPDDPLWDGGVRGGIRWDRTFYQDLSRYAVSGELFWSIYLNPGSHSGIQNGYWFNFGAGWCHLANDDLNQMLTGAAPRLVWDSAHGHWQLVIEATLFVTGAVVNVWTGQKAGGSDPVGAYTRQSGCDPTATLAIEPA